MKQYVSSPRCGSRTEKAPCISLAVGVGRSAHLSRHRHPPRALLRPYPEPEVKRDQPLMAVYSSVDSSRGRRNVMRSTIYSGFRTRRIAMKIQFEERRHSTGRGLSMGTPSGFVAGSFSRSSRPTGSRLDTLLHQAPPIRRRTVRFIRSIRSFPSTGTPATPWLPDTGDRS